MLKHKCVYFFRTDERWPWSQRSKDIMDQLRGFASKRIDGSCSQRANVVIGENACRVPSNVSCFAPCHGDNDEECVSADKHMGRGRIVEG